MGSRLRALLPALLTLCATACGSGVLFFSFTAGTIQPTPHCQDGGGQFNLLDQGGLTVLVVINSGTRIVLVNGLPGTCADLVPNTHVQVGGSQNGNTITAQSVQVQ